MNMTKPTRKAIWTAIALFTFILVAGVGSVSAKKSQVYTMTGRIAAINLNYDTVVVEVPVKDGQLMTVAGPLVDNAQLKKDGRNSNLQDFEIGNQVTVTWEKNDDGLFIRRLVANR